MLGNQNFIAGKDSFSAKYTVHQPMIFPPVYLVGRFLSVDVLVWLGRDNCKEGNDGWHTKFRLLGKSKEEIISVPIKDRGSSLIDGAEFQDFRRWETKMLKTLHTLYGSQPHYQTVLGLLPNASPWEGYTFGQYCREFMQHVFGYLEEGPKVINEKDLQLPRVEASQWLANIGSAINCTRYVCAGDATSKYLNPKPFADAGIMLEAQQYKMPAYHPLADSATVSIIDLLMRKDREQVLEILRG